MSEFLLIVATSCITTVVSIVLMMYFWIVKQEYRHKYLLKRMNLAKKNKIPSKAIPEQPGALNSLAKILPALQGLDLDQVGDIVERFTDRGAEADPEQLDGIGELLQSPALQGILQAFQKDGTATPEETEEAENFIDHINFL